MNAPDAPTQLPATIAQSKSATVSPIEAPAVTSGQRLLVVAHGNSLRALVKYLDGISEEEIPALNIPTGVPLVYELDEDLKPIKHYYLGDQEEAAKKAAVVANQAKAK